MPARSFPSIERSRSREGEKWNFWSGEGTTAAQREAEKPMRALFELQGALVNQECFWEHVAETREDLERAEAIAGRYGSGGTRRAVIGSCLRRAAAAGDREAGRRSLFAVAYYEPLAAAGPRGTYRYRGDFLDLVREGSRLIALHGAEKCFVCGCKLSGKAKSSGRTVRRDYCSAHEPRSEEERRLAAQREHAIDTVFRYAARALATLPLPPRARRSSAGQRR